MQKMQPLFLLAYTCILYSPSPTPNPSALGLNHAVTAMAVRELRRTLDGGTGVHAQFL